MHAFHFAPSRLSAVLLFVAVSAPVTRGQSTDWPQFLGPQRNGISEETGLLQRWPDDGMKVVWRVRGGVGMSAVAVSDGHAVTMWNSDEGQLVVALNVKDGQTIWKTPVAKNYKNGQGDGPRGTPAIAGDHVYAFTGDGVLACLDLHSGKEVWTRDVVGDVRVRPAEYGMACSPLIVGELVVVTAGGGGTAVVAVDRSTGETKWTIGDGTPGYSSPALLDVAGQKQIVALTGSGALGIAPEDGKLLWSYGFKTPYDCNTATPISVDGNVFLSAGENHGCVMLNVTAAGGRYTVKEVWESVDVKSVMRNEWQTSVLIDGHLYGFDNVGSAGPTTHLTCIDAATGDVIWRKNRFGKGNLVAADGHLWITTMGGELVIVKATPEGYAEVGREKLFGKTRQNASIARGMAFIRDDNEVICIAIGDH